MVRFVEATPESIVSQLVAFVRSDGERAVSRLGPTNEVLGVRVEFTGTTEHRVPGDHRELNLLGARLVEARVLLERNRNTRRAMLYLGDFDPEDGETICLTGVQFLVRRGELRTVAFSRSCDVERKLLDDYVAVANGANRLAEDLDLPRGTITFLIASVHVYL